MAFKMFPYASACAFGLLGSVLAGSGYLHAQDPRPSAQQENLQARDLSTLPTIDLTLDRTMNRQRAPSERARAQRYDLPGAAPLLDPSTGKERLLEVVLAHRYPDPLPLTIADSVVIAKIISATAHLSDDGANVYSVYGANVTENLKGPITTKQTIEVDRSGGVVKYPSGNVAVGGIRGAGFLEVGRSYYLFLRYSPDHKFLTIITGYMIDNGTIKSLDSVTDKDLGMYGKYAGLPTSHFTAEIESRAKEQ